MRTHGPLNVASWVEPLFGENTFLVWPTGQTDAWIIDPGLPPQDQHVRDALTRRRLTPAAILLTHCHADHIAGVPLLQETYPACKLWAPRDEQHMLSDANANLSAPFGFDVVAPLPHTALKGGDTLELGELKWHVLDVSGHSPGGLAFYCPAAAVVFTGDTLIPGSIGRYDFPGSSGARLLANIREKLLTLPDATVVYAGHGSASTIGHERQHNPFLE